MNEAEEIYKIAEKYLALQTEYMIWARQKYGSMGLDGEPPEVKEKLREFTQQFMEEIEKLKNEENSTTHEK